MSRRSMVIAAGVAGAVFLVACLAAVVVLGGLAQDMLAPRAAQSQAATADAEARATVHVDSRCTGLFVTGCNVTISQAQQQEQKQAQKAEQKPPDSPSKNWVWWVVIAIVVVLVFVVVLIGS